MTLPPRIIIVDDEPSVRSGLSNLLHSDGYTAVGFACGEDLLSDKGALSQADMLIIDVRLTGMSGFELFEALRTTTEMPPVIFISAEHEESAQRQAVDLGAVTFLSKPIDVDMLLALIHRELFDGEVRQ